MDGNSPKHPETVEAYVSAARVLRDWLTREGGNQRIPQVLELLADRTAADLTAGHPAPALDADSLRKLYYGAQGGVTPDMSPARWLPRTTVVTWWKERAPVIAQACRDHGLAFTPELSIVDGGGRGNPTLYRLEFCPLPSAEDLSETSNPEATPLDGIRYVVEPAKPAWWLRPLIGTAPFRMRSWRGYSLVGIVIAEGIFVTLLWLAILLTINAHRPISGSDLVSLILSAVITVAWWRGIRPFVRLPAQRVTIASDLFLAWSQAHGQIRLSRDAKSKLAGGWFQLVRHWGYCPICSGEVELQPGGEQFPGRVVGRCTDSPLEHVFSFDPARLVGSHLLRTDGRSYSSAP